MIFFHKYSSTCQALSRPRDLQTINFPYSLLRIEILYLYHLYHSYINTYIYKYKIKHLEVPNLGTDLPPTYLPPCPEACACNIYIYIYICICIAEKLSQKATAGYTLKWPHLAMKYHLGRCISLQRLWGFSNHSSQRRK